MPASWELRDTAGNATDAEIGAAVNWAVFVGGQFGLSFSLDYCDADNTWEATYSGPGKGEFFEAKKCPTPHRAILVLVSRLLSALRYKNAGMEDERAGIPWRWTDDAVVGPDADASGNELRVDQKHGG